MDPEFAFEDWVVRVQRQSALTAELSERLQQVRASAESWDGEVAVTVDHSGGLAELRLSDQAMRRPARELSEIILATSQRAQARLAKDVEALASGLYGAGSETASFIAGTYTEQFPELDEQDDRYGERDQR